MKASDIKTKELLKLIKRIEAYPELPPLGWDVFLSALAREELHRRLPDAKDAKDVKYYSDVSDDNALVKVTKGIITEAFGWGADIGVVFMGTSIGWNEITAAEYKARIPAKAIQASDIPAPSPCIGCVSRVSGGCLQGNNIQAASCHYRRDNSWPAISLPAAKNPEVWYLKGSDAVYKLVNGVVTERIILKGRRAECALNLGHRVVRSSTSFDEITYDVYESYRPQVQKADNEQDKVKVIQPLMVEERGDLSDRVFNTFNDIIAAVNKLNK